MILRMWDSGSCGCIYQIYEDKDMLTENCIDDTSVFDAIIIPRRT